MNKVAIVGIGRLGGALALALSGKGYDVAYLVHRTRKIAELVASEISPRPILIGETAGLGEYDPDIVIITTGDPEIGLVADQLCTTLKGRPTILHTSGSLSSKILSGLADIGCSIGSIHPLLSVSSHRIGDDAFEGAYFCVEGDAVGHAVGVELAAALGGMPFVVDSEWKSLYHAAAVMTCGHVTALIDVANTMIGKCGIKGQDPNKIFLPLIESTIENIKTQGTAAAITGSFARADAGAVVRHIQAIKSEMDCETLEIYRLLGEMSLRIAESNGVDPELTMQVRETIQERP